MTPVWREVGDRTFTRRHESYDLNAGLVVGAEVCLVIDTRRSYREGTELAGAVRQVTPLPWVVANTHAHFDHCFGNAVFNPDGGTQVWGHRRCAEMLVSHGEVQREVMIHNAGLAGRPDIADELAEVRIVPPTSLFSTEATVDLGGRQVVLRHLGRGHTDNDMVVRVPDAGVLFAGDLVEQGAPPSFGDGFPLDWPATMDAVLGLVGGPVVPGHGDVVDEAFVRTQRDELAATADLARQAYADGRPIEDACRDVPFPDRAALDALRRAYRQLRGEPAYDTPDQIRAQLRPVGPAG